jgi:hypothetical protein
MSWEYKLSQPVHASLFDQRFVDRGFKIEVDEHNPYFMREKIYFTKDCAFIIPRSDGMVRRLEAKIWVDTRPFLLAITEILNLTIYSEDDPQLWGYANEAEMVAAMNGKGSNQHCTVGGDACLPDALVADIDDQVG